MKYFLVTICMLASSLLTQPAFCQFGTPDPGKEERLGREIVQRWKVGTKLSAIGGVVQGLTITIPVPTNWDEQTVKIVEEDFTRNVLNVSYRDLRDGVRQMVVRVPRVQPGKEVQALVTFEVTTREVLAPKETSIYLVPKRLTRDVSKHLATSPYINSRHSTIRNKATELAKQDGTARERVEATYDWVRENIEYQNLALKGAVETLRDKKGGGEDLVNLFVALCRANKIPARIVWVQGHYYAEFYLQDEEGEGFWFPCQVAGNRDFGGVSDVRPILQKGDNIQVPEKKERVRFVPELVKGKASRGRPRVTFVRELLPNE